MKIAYYGTGNLQEHPDRCGLGMIYDINGNLILKHYEKLLFCFPAIRTIILNVKENSYYSGNCIFHDAGMGKIYRTDQRIVYIREPSISKQTAVHISYVPDIGHAGWAKLWKENGFRECWELPLNEIYFIVEKNFFKVTILIVISQDKIYIIKFPYNDHYESIWQNIQNCQKVKSVKEGLKKCNLILKQLKKDK
jgi:hypothetical protein